MYNIHNDLPLGLRPEGELPLAYRTVMELPNRNRFRWGRFLLAGAVTTVGAFSALAICLAIGAH